MTQEAQTSQSKRERWLFYLNFNVMMVFLSPIVFPSNYTSPVLFFGMNSFIWVWNLWIKEEVTNKRPQIVFTLDSLITIGYLVGFAFVIYFSS